MTALAHRSNDQLASSVNGAAEILYGRTPARTTPVIGGARPGFDLRQSLEELPSDTCLYIALDCSEDADLSREGFNARVVRMLCDQYLVSLSNSSRLRCDGFCGIEAVPTIFTIKHEQEYAPYDLDKMRDWGGAKGSSKVRMIQEIERYIKENPERPSAALLISHSIYHGPDALIDASAELRKLAPLAALITHDDQDPSWGDLDFCQKTEHRCSQSHAGAPAELLPTYFDDDQLEAFLGEVVHDLAKAQAAG